MFVFNRIVESKLFTYLVVIVTCNCIHLIYWKYIIRERLHFWYPLSSFFHTSIIIKHNEIFMKANWWSHLSVANWPSYYSSTWQKSSFNSPLEPIQVFHARSFLSSLRYIFLKVIFVDKNMRFECQSYIKFS
jgi:hypothetical protein